MATNHDIATRFAAVITRIDNANDIIAAPHQLPPYTTQLRDLRANSMRVEFAEKARNHTSFTRSENTFVLLAHGYSYNTTVAALFWNVYAQQVELWMNPRGYSNTTRGHKRKYRDAVHRALREANDTRADTIPGANPLTLKIYETGAVEMLLYPSNRVAYTLERLHSAKTTVQKHMQTVVAPRLREPTRRSAIAQANAYAQYVINLCTDSVPPQLYRGNEGLAELIGLEHFTRSLIDTPENPVPLKTLRTAVEGYFALEQNSDEYIRIR